MAEQTPQTDAEKIDEILHRLRRSEPSKRWRKIERTILAVLAAWIGYREITPSPSTSPTPAPVTTHTTTSTTHR